MGVKIGVTKPELYPPGDYRVAVLGSELNRNKPGKITVKFAIADGPYQGRQVSRSYNAIVSPSSELGKLLLTCGVPLENAQQGQQIDLDIINGNQLITSLTHYTGQNGTVNSLGNFRRFMPSQAPAAPQFVPAPAPVAAAPQTYAPPAPAVAGQPLGRKLDF